MLFCFTLCLKIGAFSGNPQTHFTTADVVLGKWCRGCLSVCLFDVMQKSSVKWNQRNVEANENENKFLSCYKATKLWVLVRICFPLTLHCICIFKWLISLKMQAGGYWHFKPLIVCFFVFALELNVSYDVKTRDYFLNCVIYISKNNLDSLWHAILLWLFIQTYVPKTNLNYLTAVKNQK